MAFLDVKKLILTPAGRVVVSFEGPPANAIAPLSYLVKMVSSSPAHTSQVTVAGNVTIARLPQVYRLSTYVLTITAQYTDPGDDQTMTAEPLLIDVQCGYAQLLRQRIWDIIFEANLEHLGRPLKCIHDGYYRPEEFQAAQGGFSGKMPALEVCDPDLEEADFANETRVVEKWCVPIKIWESGNPEDSNQVTTALWLLFERVRKAVDGTDQLGLGNFGVHGRTWTWKKKKGRIEGRDRITGFELELVVPVQRRASTVAMP